MELKRKRTQGLSKDSELELSYGDSNYTFAKDNSRIRVRLYSGHVQILILKGTLGSG